jgi:ubiquitin-conjugating enzyme E2 variant
MSAFLLRVTRWVMLVALLSGSHNAAAFGTSPLSPSWGAGLTLRPAWHPATSRIRSSTTTDLETTSIAIEDDKSSWKDDGFVFGLDGSGLERPTGRTSQVVVEGDSLATTPFQQALVTVTLAGHAAFAGVALTQLYDTNGGDLWWTASQALLLLFSSWVAADFGSGVLHWSVDNYGNGKTPVMGSIIAAFQGHHAAPWTITERGFCNNVSKLCLPFGLLPMALVNSVSGPGVTFFLAAFCSFEILSQEFHKWSHQRPSECPGWVNQLQALGLTVGRQPHAAHHLAPYEGNYCIISGLCNKALDQTGFFRRLEHVVYQWNGVESNAWKLDPALRERTLSGDYGWQMRRPSSS